MFPLRPPAHAPSSSAYLTTQPQGHLSSINLALPPTTAAAAAGLVGSTASAGLSPGSATPAPAVATSTNISTSSAPTPSSQNPSDSDLFAQLARLKHVQLSLALDHAKSPDATTPTAPAAAAAAGISPFVAGLTSGSSSNTGPAGSSSTPGSGGSGSSGGPVGSSRGTARNPAGATDPALDDAGEAAANKTKDRFALKREQAAGMTAKLADLRTVMRDITATARTLHLQAATNPPPSIPSQSAAGQQPTLAVVGGPESSTRPTSFLSPLAPASVVPTGSSMARSPALGLGSRAPAPLPPTPLLLSPNQAPNGLTGSPEMVGGMMGPPAGAAGAGTSGSVEVGWAAARSGRVIDR